MKKGILLIIISFISFCLYTQSSNPFPAVPPVIPAPVDSGNQQKKVDSFRYRSMNPQDSLHYKKNNNPMKMPDRSDTIISYPINNDSSYIIDDRDPKKHK